MAWLFGDTCDHYATGDLGAKYAVLGISGQAISVGTGRFGTNSIRFSNDVGKVGAAVVSSSATVIGGVALRATVIGTEFPFFEVWDGINARGQVLYTINSDGSISAWSNLSNNDLMVYSGATRLGSSAPGVITSNAYYSIQCKTTINASTGSCVVKVNGATVLNLTGQNTRNAGAVGNSYTLILLHAGKGSTVGDIDDLWIVDDTGPQNNDFLGDLTGEVLLPNAAGNSTQWSLTGAATNYGAVSDATPDGDTSYVSSGTVGQKDTYAHGALTRITSGIVAVQVVLDAKTSSAGTRAIAAVLRSAGTDYVGSDKYLPSTAYAMQIQPWELDPATSAAWAVAAVNASQIGQKVTV